MNKGLHYSPLGVLRVHGDVPNAVAALSDAGTERIAVCRGFAGTVTGLTFTTVDEPLYERDRSASVQGL